jgi:hypothetical protein
MLMACDQSVRGFAYAAAPTFWKGDWSKVFYGRIDGGQLSRAASNKDHVLRQMRIFDRVDEWIAMVDPSLIGFESYAFSRRPDVDVVELVGMIKRHAFQLLKETVTINQSSARKLLLGKVPRKGDEAKAQVRSCFQAAGMPEDLNTLDHTDALCVLNFMMSEHGGLCFGQK